MFPDRRVLGCAVVLLVGILFRRAAASAHDLGAVADAVPATVEPRAQPVVCRTLRVYFIKPSKYDDAGWVQWFWKGVLPNNTLTVLAALNDTTTSCTASSASTSRPCSGTSRWTGRSCRTRSAPSGESPRGRRGGHHRLAGVQTNQYPRGRDLALRFRRAGSRCSLAVSTWSGYPETRTFLEDCGITTVVGEAETIWCELLDDYIAGRLRRTYSVTDGIRAKTGSGEITVPVITDAQLPAISDPYLHASPPPP